MKSKKSMAILFVLLSCHSSPPNSLKSPPIAKKVPHELTIHGHKRIDPYFWMRERENPEVTQYLISENDYTERVMSDTKEIQKNLYEEMIKRIPQDDASFPYQEGNYDYFSKNVAQKNYRQYWRTQNSRDELILDFNQLAEGKNFFAPGSIKIHPNEDIIAYATDEKGSRLYNIFFKDLKTNTLIPRSIALVADHFEWAQSGKVLFYVKPDPTTMRYSNIIKYDFDTDKHELVFEEKDEKFDATIEKTFSNKYLVINTESSTTSESWILDAQKPSDHFKLFHPRKQGHLYYIEDNKKDMFYIRSNHQALNFQIFTTPMDKTNQVNWQSYIKHRPSVMVENMLPFEKFLVLEERNQGLAQIQIIPVGKPSGEYLKFPEACYEVGLRNNRNFTSSKVRYEFESLKRPMTLYDFNFDSKKSTLLKEDKFNGYDPSLYATELVYAKSHDGKSIPISLLYKKTTARDGSAPLFIDGYGSYGVIYPNTFSPRIISLLDRGFISASAHVRGGADLGRGWYEDGKLLKKKNTFLDFISATEFLIQNKYVHPKKIYASGKSAGGLLMGAITNLRPDLYDGIIAQVPFVDVVTTMLDSTLPLTTNEYEEWGNPNNKKYYDYMLSYSPYDQVSQKKYPHILATGAWNDRQVSYWEPAKWIAKLRDYQTDKNKLMLLKTSMSTGHSGKSGRFHALEEVAFRYAFILKLSHLQK